MNIQIRDMTMPDNCERCRIFEEVYGECQLLRKYIRIPECGRHEECPLEEKNEMEVNEKYNELVKELLELEEKVEFFSLTRRERRDFQNYVEGKLEE